MNQRAYNFSAGPSMLPVEVLEEAAKQMLNYRGCGESVMEMSHRSKAFKEILQGARENLKQLLNIPSNYQVLFLQGGATLQFSMIPLNLMGKNGKADYVVTGSWAKKAAKEAEKYGDINIVASSEEDNFTYIPRLKAEDFRKDADYVHITYNNTIYGTHYAQPPETGDIPLVADMSSCLLSEEIDVSRFGLIYAGAQKNIGPAGMTIVIIREDLIGKAKKDSPVYLDYQVHADNDSSYNTPPCYSIYMAGEVFKHLLDRGGVSAMAQRNRQKADLLYDFIDQSGLFNCPVDRESRSQMNVVFVTGDEDLDKKFVEKAKEQAMHNLNGHRSIGGMRASIYNAMPLEGVKKLIEMMKEFEGENQ